MFEVSVDRLCGAVARTCVVEEGEDVVAALGQGAAESCDLDQAGGDGGSDRVDQPRHRGLALSPAAGAKGGDHLLVDAPGGLDLDVPIIGEQLIQATLLLVSE